MVIKQQTNNTASLQYTTVEPTSKTVTKSALIMKAIIAPFIYIAG